MNTPTTDPVETPAVVTKPKPKQRIKHAESWYMRHREEVLAAKKTYYQENREARRAYGHGYYTKLRGEAAAFRALRAMIQTETPNVVAPL
jgi:hypothetical protein